MYTSYLPSKPLTDTLFYLTDKLSISNYAGIDITANGFYRLPAYKPEVIVNRYGPLNELLQQQKQNDLPLAYIYNYLRAHLVATATNASFDQIAYSSFEANDNGGFAMNNAAKSPGVAITGTVSYILNSAVISPKVNFPNCLQEHSM